jgi:hypothetical protein
VKTVNIDQTNLAACVEEAQHARIVVMRNGVPAALVVGLEGMDEEQVELGFSDCFWQLISERREQNTLSRAALEQKITDTSSD